MGAESYRVFTLCDSASKLLAWPVTAATMEVLKQSLRRATRGTDFTWLFTLAAQGYAKARGISCAFLFVDRRAAFSSICRQVAPLAPDSCDELAKRSGRNGSRAEGIRTISEGSPPTTISSTPRVATPARADCPPALHLRFTVDGLAGA